MSEGTDFSRVVLSLENICLPYEKLKETPSTRDNMNLETETELRNLGCELIQTAGMLLKMPQVAMATGQILFQRFFYSKSFVKHNYEHIAMACVNLAGKIEEEPRRLRDVLSVFHHIKQMRDRVKMTVSPLILDQRYVDLKSHTIKAERRVLKELGFCVHVKHPHKIIVMYMQVLNCHRNPKFVQTAWNFMNDCLRTHVFMRFDPETIACACIYLAARQLQIPLPNDPHWFSALRVPEEDIREVCLELLKNYARSRPSVEKLERILRQAKEKLQLAKHQSRLAGATHIDGTPTCSVTGSPRLENLTPLKGRRRDDRSPDAPRPATENRGDSSTSPAPPERRRSAPSSPQGEKNGARLDSGGRRKRTPPRGYRDDSASPVPEKRPRAERAERVERVERERPDKHYRHDKTEYREERHHKRRSYTLEPCGRRSTSYSPVRALSPVYRKKERRRDRSPRERRRKKDKVSNGRHRTSPDRRADKYKY